MIIEYIHIIDYYSARLYNVIFGYINAMFPSFSQALAWRKRTKMSECQKTVIVM